MSTPPPTYRIDPQTNRDIVDQIAGDAFLSATEDAGDLTTRGQRVSVLRSLGRLDEAAREGQAAYQLARQDGTPRQQIAALLRLAHVRQYQRAWGTADAMFAEARARAEELSDPIMMAFAHQHSGRNYVDQQRYAEAVASFQAALSLREAHGAPPDQLRSTREALAVAQRRLGGENP